MTSQYHFLNMLAQDPNPCGWAMVCCDIIMISVRGVTTQVQPNSKPISQHVSEAVTGLVAYSPLRGYHIIASKNLMHAFHFPYCWFIFGSRRFSRFAFVLRILYSGNHALKGIGLMTLGR